MTQARDGFTLVELLVALVLFGLVGTSIYQVLVTNQRLYLRQTETVSTNQAARAAASVLPGEIRELSATDVLGSDVLTATATGFRYRALQNVYFACADALAGTVTVDGTRWFGLRAIAAGTDSLLVFAENDPTTRTDDTWRHVDVTAAVAGVACSGGAASLTLTVNGDVTGVLTGAPVRAFQPAEVSLYEDASGDWWLGRRTYDKAGAAWSSIQPVVGPLTEDGLALVYYDENGAVTADRALIARIGIAVTSTGTRPMQSDTGPVYVLQDLQTEIALRNNCRYSC